MLIFNPPQLSELEKFVREYDRIFIDTCSFLHESAEKFFQNITPILARERKQIILPLAVYEELRKLAKRVDAPVVNMRTRNICQNIIPQLLKTNLPEIYSDPDDGNFADNVFLYVFQKIKLRYNVLFIKQDGGLAHDARDIFKDSRSVKGVKKILVCKLDKSGLAQKFFVDGSNKNPQTFTDDVPKKFPQVVEVQKNIPSDEQFKLADKVVNIGGNLTVSHIPTEGEFVTAIRDGQTRQIRLEEVGKGGEGSVYKTDLNGIVAKIYKPEKLTCLRHEKLKLMLTKKIDCDGVCFPLALLHNQRNEFVGYAMKAASGRDLGKSVFIEKIPRPKLCPKCLVKKDRVWEYRTCTNCGEMFNITYGQKEFFEQKGLNLPTRCKNCRGKPQLLSKSDVFSLMINNFR